ncbi:MAG: cupredoxin family protein [Thiolinea sp.]
MEQQLTLPRQHIAMALKYGGISFIAGSVSHGVFSGQRSLITAGIGVLAFILGMWLENKDNGQKGVVLIKSLAISTLLAISLGLFTGSLQHFPDSPSRSLWAVPLGFAVSIVALVWVSKQAWTKSIQRYALASFAIILVGSGLAYQHYSTNPVVVHDHATGHGDAQANAAGHDNLATGHAHNTETAIGLPGKTEEVERTVVVEMADTMRFSPENLDVKQGETVRLVVRNNGKIRHELTLGTIADLKDHAALMLKHPNMQHTDPNMVQVEPSEVKEVVWKFSKAGTVDFACLQPGHFEAGMKGLVQVTQ